MFGLSPEDKKKLAQFQSQAAFYYGDQRYDQALESVRRGLDIAPEDYKLMSLGARCLMFTAKTKPSNLGMAEALYDRVIDARGLDDQAPHALLGYAQCQKLLAFRGLNRADALDKEAESQSRTELEKLQDSTAAEELRKKAMTNMGKAVRMFGYLIERDEQPRNAHFNLMDIKRRQKDWPAAIKHGKITLRLNGGEQKYLDGEIRRTNSFGWEQAKRAELKILHAQERDVRMTIGRIYFFEQKNYEKAIEQLTAMLEDDPTRSNDYYNRGRAYEMIGKVQEACLDYQKFISTHKLERGNDKVLHAYRFAEKHR